MILFFAFFAGVLSVLAPCVLPVLPVLLGGGISRNGEGSSSYIILISSLFFIFIFTFLLKVSTSLLHIDPKIWNFLSALIIMGYGLILLFPQLWEQIKSKFWSQKSSKSIKREKKTGIIADIILGASLGPLFASCSPTYALIIGTILPQNLWMGTLSIFMYILWFGAVLFFIIYFGKEAIKKLSRYANPNGIFKKIIGVIFILTGLGICSGAFKYIETRLVDAGVWSSLLKIEKNALQNIQ